MKILVSYKPDSFEFACGNWVGSEPSDFEINMFDSDAALLSYAARLSGYQPDWHDAWQHWVVSDKDLAAGSFSFDKFRLEGNLFDHVDRDEFTHLVKSACLDFIEDEHRKELERQHQNREAAERAERKEFERLRGLYGQEPGS